MSHLPFSSAAEAPDERATLLAYKTAVAFPVRFSQPGVFLAQSLGVAEPVTSSTATAEKIVVAAATTSTPDDAAITASSEPGDPAADGSSSSSSSDSDSDSDSDSEDEKSEVEAETKTSPPDLSESTVKKEAEVQEVTSKVKEDNHKNKKEDPPICASEAVPEATPAAVVATIEAVQATVEAPSVSSEELVDSAPEICTAIENSPKVPSIKGSSVAASTIVPDAQTQFPSKAVTERATSERVPTDVPIGTTHLVSAEASAEAKAATAEVAAETATEISAPVESAEELVDRAPVVAETAGEKLQAEAGVKPPEGTYYTPLSPKISVSPFFFENQINILSSISLSVLCMTLAPSHTVAVAYTDF